MNQIISLLILSALLQAAPASDTPKTFSETVSDALPTWESDTLAQFEQPELAVVRGELSEIEAGRGSEDKLREDWRALEVIDTLLKKRRVI